MNAETYFTSEGVSNTMLGKMDNGGTPAHLQSYLSQPQEATRAMEIGSWFHEFLLLKETPQNLAIRPEGPAGNFTTKEGKAWRNEQLAAGKTPIKKEEHDSIFGMANSIMANRLLAFQVEHGVREEPLFAQFNLGGSCVRKGKLDLRGHKSPALFDFKSVTDASPKAFQKTLWNMGYFRQAAYYLDLAKDNSMEFTEFVFVAVEKTPPYAVGIYHLDHEAIGYGRKRYIELLQLYIACRDEGKWPAYSENPQTIGLPSYAVRELEAA